MTHYFMRDEKNRKWVEVGTPKPADMVSVVRCRDCKYYITNADGYGGHYFTCSYFDSELIEVEPDGFCAWGKPAPAGSGEPTPEIKACEAARDNASDKWRES